MLTIGAFASLILFVFALFDAFVTDKVQIWKLVLYGTCFILFFGGRVILEKVTCSCTVSENP
jgi:hypothetical protein